MRQACYCAYLVCLRFMSFPQVSVVTLGGQHLGTAWAPVRVAAASSSLQFPGLVSYLQVPSLSPSLLDASVNAISR